MIFYFTGTGNSWYAAKRLIKKDELMVNITKCMDNRQYTFEVPEGEALGFVFPVYYGGLPSIVKVFLKRLKITSRETFTYAVITCGASIGNAGGQLKKVLAESGLGLDAVYQQRMPDNYAKMYQPSTDEQVERLLREADEHLKEIRRNVEDGETNRCEGDIAGKLMTGTLYPMYVKGRNTMPFYADERCVGCGVCAKRCPVHAIVMQDGKPEWIKPKCVDCMACCRCNAIQYGKKMLKHSRYVNPEYKAEVKP